MSKKYNYNSEHCITDESEEENINVDWTINSDEENKKDNKENPELDELEEIENFDEFENFDALDNLEEINIKKQSPEINIEIVNQNNKKGVKVNINIEISKNKNTKENNCITIDFIINKETFLKIAKELKNKK